MADELNITEEPLVDESIERFQYMRYHPEAGTNLNTTGDIRINIEVQSLFLKPSDAYFLFEGRLTKADGTAYADADAVALTNNGLMYLFNSISYYLSGKETETVQQPGRVTTMFGLLTYPVEYQNGEGLNQLWARDTVTTTADKKGFEARQAYLIQSPTAKGTFSFMVPLRHIFGFCDDYDKVVYGFQHQLTLVRKSDDDAIFRAAGVDAGKITLDAVSLFMPNVIPADMAKISLYKTIESKTTVPVAFRSRHGLSISVPQTTEFTWPLGTRASSEKPRYIIVGFQTGKYSSQTTNPALFDHCNLQTCTLN